MSRQTKSKVYIVGAGPGHPGLMTLRAVECLKKADVILYDRLIPKNDIRFIAPKARLIYVGKKASFHTLKQDAIEDLLVREAKKNQIVVRLKGGDPFIFGRGGEEAERLYDEGIEFEVVPGVSSAFAVPLFGGIPLTHRKFSTEIAIVTGHENPSKGKIAYRSGVERHAPSWVDWSALSKMGTIVFLMGMGNIRANMKQLKNHGKSGKTPVAVIRWGGLGKQKTVIGTIDTIADQIKRLRLKAPATIVVGEVVSLSKKINWFERGAFYGQTFLITRDPESNHKLSRSLLERSANVIDWPSFQFSETRMTAKLKQELKRISSFDWIVFTSSRAVSSFLSKYDKVHDDFRALTGLKIAAIGSKTAKKLKTEKLWVDLIPKESSAKGLAAESVFKRKKNLKIFIPQAKDARKDFIECHAKRHKITAIPFYQKEFIKQDSKEVKKIKTKKIDWALFYSPSAVDGFLANFNKNDGLRILQKVKIAVIGKTTAAHVKSLGLDAVVVAREASDDGILAMMEGDY